MWVRRIGRKEEIRKEINEELDEMMPKLISQGVSEALKDSYVFTEDALIQWSGILLSARAMPKLNDVSDDIIIQSWIDQINEEKTKLRKGKP